MAKQVIILSTTPAVGGVTTVNYVMWLVPSGSNVVPLPGYVSMYGAATSAEQSALQAGTVIETIAVAQYPSSFSLATIEADLLTKYTAAQSALTSTVNPIQWYGTYYDGVLASWTSQSLSLPSLPPSTFTSAVWTNATALNTAAALTLRGAPTALVTVVLSGTITAGQIGFQVSVDNINWYGAQGIPTTGFQPLAGFGLTGNQSILFNVVGYSYFRTNLTVAITGSGTATISIQSSTSPSVGLLTAGTAAIYNSSAPFTSSGSSVPTQVDAYGSAFVKPYRRSQTIATPTTITTTTATTIMAAQAAGVYADISTLVVTAPSSATASAFNVTLSDGTLSYIYDMNVDNAVGTQELNLCFDPPLPATTAATAWTLKLSVAETIHVTCVAVLQKAS